MTRFQRELISRGTMLVLAIALLWGGIALLRSGWNIRQRENEERKIFYPHGGRQPRVNVYLFVGGGLLCVGGLYLLRLGLFSHRNLEKQIVPPQMKLWENPEPGHTPRHF